MFARRLMVVFAVIAAFTLSFASLSANAQSASAGTCADPGYITAFASTGTAMKAVDFTNTSTVGSSLLALIKARSQFEDTVPPVGCEAAKTAVVAFLSAEEDSLYAVVAVKADTANAADYTKIANGAAARIQKLATAVTSAFASAPAAASTGPVATAAAAPPQVCSDAALSAQVKSDTSPLSGMTGTDLAPVIALRYKYEDMTSVPTGCSDGVTLLIQSFMVVEDQISLSLLAQADTANASSYTDFITNTLAPRASALGKNALIAFPSLAATAAPTASS